MMDKDKDSWTSKTVVSKDGVSSDDTSFKKIEVKKKKAGPKVMPITPRNKIGRNTPCPCRSGKKFKKCCLLKRSISVPRI